MLHTQSEEDSSAGKGVGRDFFQVLPENNGEYSPGLFPQEVRKEIPTFARKQSWGGLGVEGILLHFCYAKRRQDVPPRVGGDRPWPLQGTQTLATSFFRQLGALSWPPPTTIWEVAPPPFFPKQGWEGSLALSPTMWRGFLKRQWAHSPHRRKWYETCYGIKLLPKKDRVSLSLAPSKREMGEHSRRNAKGCVHRTNMGGIDSGG